MVTNTKTHSSILSFLHEHHPLPPPIICKPPRFPSNIKQEQQDYPPDKNNHAAPIAYLPPPPLIAPPPFVPYPSSSALHARTKINLSKCGIPSNFETEENRANLKNALSGLVQIYKNNNEPLTFEYVGNCKPGRLVAIPVAKNRQSFMKTAKMVKWVEQILEHIKATSSNTIDSDLPDGAATTSHEAAEWLLEYLSKSCEESFIAVANEIGLHSIRKMSAEEAAAMWADANVSMKASEKILKHLRMAFGTHLQVPRKQINSLVGKIFDFVKPFFGTFDYYPEEEEQGSNGVKKKTKKTNTKKKTEKVSFWMSDFCDLLAVDIEQMIYDKQKEANKKKQAENVECQAVPVYNVFFRSAMFFRLKMTL